MNYYLPLLFVALLFATLTSVQAQTVLSITSRGDLASTFGHSNPQGPSSYATKSIGTRASFGLEMVRFAKERQAVVVGLEYTRSGFDYKMELYGVDDVTNDPVPNTSELKGVFRYDFISLPLGYRFYKPINKWRLYGQVSLVPMAYLKTISFYEITGAEQFEDANNGRRDYFQDFHLASSAAIGIERTVFKSWTIGLQPTFRVHLTSVTNTEFHERPWTAGLQLNVGRTFTRKRRVGETLVLPNDRYTGE